MVTYARAMNVYVLVGGRSRRMSTSKTDLFLPRVVAAARPVFDSVIAVQRAGGDAVGAIRTIHEEPHEGEGPMFGVARALRDADGRCFIIAVDYPLITTPFLRYLRDRFDRSAAAALVPVWNELPQPLCAGYDATVVLPLVEERLAVGDLAMRRLIADAGAEMITETELRARFEGEPLLNANTPHDLQEATRRYGP